MTMEKYNDLHEAELAQTVREAPCPTDGLTLVWS
jgi:hypothetical protein